MTYLKIETECFGSDGNVSSIMGVQYFFHPPVMANTLKVLWLKKGGNGAGRGGTCPALGRQRQVDL